MSCEKTGRAILDTTSVGTVCPPPPPSSARRHIRDTGARLVPILRNAALVAALSFIPLHVAAADPFLPQIVISSTVPANGDLNPYGVAVVPLGFPSGAAVRPGDILVSNFNNKDNSQGTGSTIIKLTANGTIAPSGSASVFFPGGSGLGLTTALGILRKGFVIVGNVPTSDGTIATIKPGSLLVIDRNGKLVSTIPSNAATTLDGPWDLTIFDGGDEALLFVSNVLNGTVSRLDLTVGNRGITVTRATRIASGYTHVPNAAALVLGPTGLVFDADKDVLFVASTGDNAIFKIDNAAARRQAVVRGTLVTQDSHLRGPLALASAPNGDLLAANGDAVNADPAHPSEIVEFTRAGHFVTEFNVDAGQGGAFGLAVGRTSVSSRSLVAVDDVANSVQVYPLSPEDEDH